ncbi:hypothetical protein BDV29DRAFT_178048 [Aspergillus leporis]|jgi:hypothetical protein|uniref:Uncharacterized protein n=1 Tax=Aspergillus leporis TaxID=41062 RepID=A0A5N5WU80_9EURO|nr:hypothetical protein BDV29DRAFT_178048 [Aspergillus leporis]
MISKNARTCSVERSRCAGDWAELDVVGNESRRISGLDAESSSVFWVLERLVWISPGMKAEGGIGGYVVAMLQNGHGDGDGFDIVGLSGE